MYTRVPVSIKGIRKRYREKEGRGRRSPLADLHMEILRSSSGQLYDVFLVNRFGGLKGPRES